QNGLDELLKIPADQRDDALTEDVFLAYRGIAAAHTALGHSTEAREALSKGSEAASGHDRASAAAVLSRLVRRYQETGDARQKLGDQAGARQDYERSLALARDSLPIARDRARDQNDLNAHQDLATLYETVGGLERATGHDQAARDSYRKGAEV